MEPKYISLDQGNELFLLILAQGRIHLYCLKLRGSVWISFKSLISIIISYMYSLWDLARWSLLYDVLVLVCSMQVSPPFLSEDYPGNIS